MSVSARLELDHLFGGSVKALGLLSDSECADLLSEVRELRRRERAEIMADFNSSLAGFPKFMRPLLRYAFFGDGLK